MKLLDLAVLGVAGGLVYYTWHRKNVVAPQPIPEVKKLIKKVKATAKPSRQPAAARQSFVTDQSPGQRVNTKGPDGGTSHHVVGRGVRSIG